MKKLYITFLVLFFTSVSANLHAATWYVRINANGDGKTPNNAFGNINAALAAAAAGDVIDIGEGEFTANNLVVNKQLTIRGTDSDDTIFNGSGTFITFTAGGTNLANPTIIENIGLEGYKYAFADVRSFTNFSRLAVNGSTTDANVWAGNVVTFANGASNVQFEFTTFYNYWGEEAADANIAGNANGAAIIQIPDDYSVSNISFKKVNFESAGYGFYASQSNAPAVAANVSNILFYGCYFGGIKHKGIYAEKISGLTVEDCAFEDVGYTTTGEPGAIDISFAWQTYTGDINIKNSRFVDCASPASGSDANGTAVRVRALTAGFYGSSPGSWSGNLYVDKCHFRRNNAGIIVGGAYEGFGTGQNNTLSGVVNISNSVFEENNQGTAGTYNHFDIRHIATNTMNVDNCFFLRDATIKNPTVETSFAPGQVSDVNSNGGTVNITNNNLIGQFYAETSTNVYTGFATFDDALNAIPSGNGIYILKRSSQSLIPTINTSKSFNLHSASGGFDFFNNFTLNNNAQVTLNGTTKFTGTVNLNSNGSILIPDYSQIGFNSFGSPNGKVVALGSKSLVTFSSSTPHTLPEIVGTPLVLELGNTDFSANTDISAQHLLFYNNSSLEMNNQTLTLETAMGRGDIEAKFGTVKLLGTKYLSRIETEVNTKNFILNNNIGLELTGNLNIYDNLDMKNGNLFLVSKTNDGSGSGDLYFGADLVYDNSGPTGGMIVINSETDGDLGKVFRADKLNFTFPIATYKNGSRLNLPVTINLYPLTVFEYDEDSDGANLSGEIYLTFKKGLSQKAPAGTAKFADFSVALDYDDLSNLNFTATFGYDENLFNGGLNEPELALYRFNGTTNPNLKRYTATKNTTANTYAITDTKLGEFMFLADNATIPTLASDFPVVNRSTEKGFSTIQAAIDDPETEDNHTIKIAAGTYPEFLTINKSVYLKGNNAGVESWNWAKPITEIIPPTTDFTKPLLLLDTNYISIDGIAFDGANNLLNDATPRTINGVASRASVAVGKEGNDYFGFDINNNSFKNFRRGIVLFALSEQNNNLFSGNSFDNIIGVSGDSGSGILLSNFTTDIKNNRFSRVDRAIHVQYTADCYGYMSIADNNISAYRYGILGLGDLGSQVPTLFLENNTISKADYSTWTADGFAAPTANALNGIAVVNTIGYGDVAINSNHVSNAKYGIYLSANAMSNFSQDKIKITDGIYSNNEIGIYEYNTGINFNTRTLISGTHVTNSTIAGIVNENDSATPNISSELFLMDGVVVDHPASVPSTYETGIAIFGSKAVLRSLNDTKLGSADKFFIKVLNNAMTGETVSAEDVTFDGTVDGETFTNYKPSATLDLTLRAAAKSKIFDGEDAGNTTAGIVTIPNALPVSLVDFTANLKTQGVVLGWSTLSELDNKTFILEKSIDGKVFTELTRVEGKGSFNGLSKYGFVDAQFNQSCYYRLSQEDFNGNKKVYTEMVRYVKTIDQLSFDAYPNPTTDKVFLSTNGLPKNTKINLVDLKGNILNTQLSGEATMSFETATYPPGIYILQIDTELPINPIRFIKQ